MIFKNNTCFVNLKHLYNAGIISCKLQCSPGRGVYKMVKSLEKDNYIMILGGGCSTVTESTAQVSFLWNLTQVCNSTCGYTICVVI